MIDRWWLGRCTRIRYVTRVAFVAVDMETGKRYPQAVERRESCLGFFDDDGKCKKCGEARP